jgi:sterol 3beta-glucosyltransferase
MQVVIMTVGSRGDVLPYIALGLGLQAAGDRVRLANHRDWENLIRERGLDFSPLYGNPFAMLRTGWHVALRRAGPHPISVLQRYMNNLKELIENFLTGAWEAGQDADAIIFSYSAFPGYHIAEKLGVPAFAAYLQPMTPTRAFANPFIPVELPLGGIFNRFSHWFVEQLFWQPFRPMVNHWRRNVLELAPIPITGIHTQMRRRGDPVLYGYSAAVIPRPVDWCDSFYITGYWYLDLQTGWQPSQELIRFIESGTKPVYVGFSSMGNQEDVTNIVLKALARAGQRAVVFTGWGRLSQEELPEETYKVDRVPHDWLLPHMAAAFSHGGTGSLAAALLAGIPPIVIPCCYDQPFWAWQARKLGVAPKPVHRKRLTVERLIPAVEAAVYDPGIRKRAMEIGHSLQTEGGVTHAVKLIHQYCTKG